MIRETIDYRLKILNCGPFHTKQSICWTFCAEADTNLDRFACTMKIIFDHRQKIQNCGPFCVKKEKIWTFFREQREDLDLFAHSCIKNCELFAYTMREIID